MQTVKMVVEALRRVPVIVRVLAAILTAIAAAIACFVMWADSVVSKASAGGYENTATANARASVRMWESDSGSCSVVVVAPNVAMTAEHCLVLMRDGLIEGHKPTQSVTDTSGKDLAAIVVPGLDCPCAPISSVDAETGDRLFGVHYPRGVLRVLTWGVAEIRTTLKGHPVRAAIMTVAPGSSGGGVFNADGRLVGVVSMMIPYTTIMFYSELVGSPLLPRL